MFGFGVDDIISTGMKLLDKIIPDPIQKAEAQAKLLQLQQDGQIKLEEFAVKSEEIAAGDRDSARKRQIEMHDWTPNILAGFIICGYFGIQWFLLTHIVPQEMRDIIMRMLGILDMALGMVLQYFFGSSANSRQKDATIRDMSK